MFVPNYVFYLNAVINILVHFIFKDQISVFHLILKCPKFFAETYKGVHP